jgi:hypothetical protein
MFFGNNYEYSSIEFPKKKIFVMYFREYINKFSQKEREMTKGINNFVKFYNLGYLLKMLPYKNIQLIFCEKKIPVTFLHLHLSNDHFKKIIFSAQKNEDAKLNIIIELENLAKLFSLESLFLVTNITTAMSVLRKITVSNIYHFINKNWKS